MRLRITLGLVGILVIALVLAGGVSLFLVRRAASDSARETVLREASRLVDATRAAGIRAPGCTASDASATATSCANFANLLPLIESIAGISEAGILYVDHTGRLLSHNTPGLPKNLFAGVPAQRLAKGRSVAGTYGATAYAAAPLLGPGEGPAGANDSTLTVAIVLAVPISNSFANAWYFLLAGGISLLVAAAIAAVFTSRVSRRVIDSARAAEQIAGGDLGARVDAGPRDYPELRALSGAINTMAAGLEQSRELERNFLLSISHDLRTPLTSIRGYAEAIADGAALEPRRAAEVIVSQSDRLQRLIGDLLQLARLQLATFEYEIVTIALPMLVAETATALTYAFESAGIALELDLPGAPVEVRTDPHRLAQIVTNLLENALKFARSTVRLGVRRADTDVVVTVEDDGTGISPEDLPHVFERLYTTGRAEARSAGTGLGLAIVAELSAAMGIDVEVISPLDEHGGTRLCLRLDSDVVAAQTT